MSVTIMSITQATFNYTDFDYVISITNKSAKSLRLGSNHIQVRFDDAESPNFSEKSDMHRGVKKILQWVSDHKLTGNEKIMVHCHAGISRSSAMAWALLVMFGEDYVSAYTTLKEARPMIWPNLNVIRIADDLLGLDGAFLQVAQELDFSYEAQNY